MIPPIAGRTTAKTYHSLVHLLKAPDPPAPSTSAVPEADSDSAPHPVPPGTQRCPHCHALIPATPATGGLLSVVQLLKAQRDASGASASSSAVPAETPAARPPAIPTPPDSDAEPEFRVEAPDPNPMSPALTDPAVPSILEIPIPRAPIPEFSKTPDPPTPPSTERAASPLPAIPIPPTTTPELLETPDPPNPPPTDPSAPPLPAGIRCTAHVQILPADDPPLPPSPSPSASTDPAALPSPPSTSPGPLAGIPPALLQVALRAAADEEQRLALQAALEASLPAALQVALQAALHAALPPLLTKLEEKIDDWRRFERKNYNRALGDGSAVPFEPVPFPDGTLPSANPSTPTPLTSLAAIDGLESAELVEYCSRYYPDRVYAGVFGGLGADGEDERGRERERARRIRDVRVAVGWVGGGDGDGAGAGDGGEDRGEEDKSASASVNGNGNGQAADDEDPETDVSYSDPAYAALGL